MHDIYYGAALPPYRKPLQILTPSDRIGVPYLRCSPEKIIAVGVDKRERSAYAAPSRPVDRDSPLSPVIPDFLSHDPVAATARHVAAASVRRG